MAAVPEWAPDGENHLLRSTSAVQKIVYSDKKIKIKTFDNDGNQVFRLVSRPKAILINGKLVSQNAKNNFNWRPIGKGGVLKLDYTKGNDIEILF